MSLREVAVASAANPAPAPGSIRFLGNDGTYWRLLSRGALLLVLTLGIYRFWLATDVRRFLWGDTEIGGDHLEYTGTAIELLIGFLIAIAILLPINIMLFFVALDLEWIGELSGMMAFGLLALLGQFAIYRARRYRLSRTVFRGVRFHQTGSAWVFALYALMWWTLTVLTLGLAYPWMLKSLERFKMRHTHCGDLTGHFEASARALFLRGFPLWLFTVGPLLGGLVAAIYAIDWPALAEAVNAGGSGLSERIEATNPGYVNAIIFLVGAAVWSMVAAAAFYPTFQGMILRWWISGIRFGALTVSSDLRIGDIYRAYGRFLLYGLMFAGGCAIAASIVAVLAEPFTLKLNLMEADELVGAAIVMLGYMILMLGFSTIYQATVKLALWRIGMESAEIYGIAVLDHVKAAGRPASSVGEGLADALNVGGF